MSGNALLSLILQEFFEILIRGKRVSKEWSFDTSFHFSSRGAIDSSRSTGMMRSKQQFEGVIKQCQWPISEVCIFFFSGIHVRLLKIGKIFTYFVQILRYRVFREPVYFNEVRNSKM